MRKARPPRVTRAFLEPPASINAAAKGSSTHCPKEEMALVMPKA